jgi:hypothetical protein
MRGLGQLWMEAGPAVRLLGYGLIGFALVLALTRRTS